MKKHIYRKFIKSNYDTEIAFLEGPITRLFSTKNKKTKKIAWIHNDISKVFGDSIKSKIKCFIDRKIYSKFQVLVFVSRDNLKKFNNTYKDLRNEYLEPVKKEVIHNYIDKELVLKKANQNIDYSFCEDTINFVTVARLVPQKAIDRLIKIHKKLIDNGKMHNFYIIGDGPEKEKLQNMIKANNIQNTFHLLGAKENPYPYMKEADYFALLTHFEGYPMVLEEAKILNKKIIITDTAAREVVEKYKEAIITENNEDMIYKTLENVIEKGKKEKNTEEQNDYDNINIITKIEKIVGE